MEAKTRKSAHRALALVLALMLCLTLLIGSAPSSGAAGSGDEATWTKVTSADQFTTGQYYMVTDTSYAPGKLDGAWVTAVEAANAATDAVWTLTVTGDSVTLTDANDVSIAPKGGNKNGIEQGDYDWAWSFNKGKFTFSGRGNDTVVLASNTTQTTGENRFRAYKTTTVNSNPDQYPSEFTLYKLEGGSGEVTVAAPQASPQAGAVVSGTEITLTCATSDASIYYTLDGSDPRTSGTQYTAPFEITGNVGATVTLKAVAIKDDVSSAVQTLTYTIMAESEAPIANGDKVVIYNPGSGLAMSANSVSTYYRAAKAINVENGQISGSVVDDLIWDVAVDADGNYTFSNGDDKISINDTNNSLPLNDKNDTWKIEAAATDGCFYIINVGRETYVQYTKYGSTDEFTTYSYSSGKEASFAMQFIKVAGDAPDPEPTLPIADGDNVVIYAPAYNKALSTNYDGYYNKGTDVTAASDGTLSGYTAADVWTVIDNKDGTWSFSYNGQKLGMGDSYSSMPLGEKNDKWVLEEAADGTWYVKNTVRNAYIEWYARNNNWSAYYNIASGSEGMFALKFYKVTGDIPEPSENPFKAGDSVVIYTPSNNMALSATTKNSYYPIGVEVVVDGDEITGYGATEIWTVNEGADGWTFTSNGGETLSVGDSYNTTYPGAGDNETWALEATGTEGQYYMKNVGRGTYLFWDDEHTDWNTSTSTKTAVSFRVVEPTSEDPDDKPEGLVVLASPVSGATVEEGETITLTTMEGATIYYTVNGGDPTTSSTKYTGELTVGSGQVPVPMSGSPLIVKAIAVIPADETAGTAEQVSDVYTFTYQAPMSLDGYQLYFGQLHSHTNISDGAGSVTDAFEHAAGVENLDFLAVTDHSNSFDNEDDSRVDLGTDLMDVSNEWKQGHDAADAITKKSNGTFVGIYGFEMTWSGGFGHINTFNTPGFESRNSDEFENNPTGHVNYYNKLVEVEKSLSQFNHPGTTFGDFADFGYYSQAYDECINLIEVGNGEGAIGSSGYFPSYEYYTRALDKGWHVAPTNNQDNHKGNWGDSNTARSVVLASELTEDAIYDAIANHRVYATEDNDLSILYSLNDNVMGSIIGEQDAIEIEAQISDQTDSADMTVEVIVNGGLVIGSKTLSGGKGTVTFNFDSNDYSYYYLRVTQADKNIAVTAPVWTGESINAGISKTECDTVLVVKDETVNISSELFNNSNLDMQVTSLVYTVDGETIYTADVTAIGNNGVISTGGTAIVSFPHAFTAGGATSVEATMIATIGDTAYTFTSVLQLTVTDESLVTRVLVDGTHWNDYVNGYYSGNMTNLIEIGGSMNAQVTIQQPGNPITADDLKDVALLVISAPLKYTSEYTGEAVVSTFEDSFIEVVRDYVNGGGTVIVCGLADYQDANNHQNGTYTTYTQVNNLLQGIGSSMRVNDDELIDQNENGGQPYRLYFDDFNFGSTDPAVQAALAGLQGSDKVYSSYSGCSVNVGNGAAIVYGHDTTYSINSKAPAQGHDKPVLSYEDAYNEDTAVVKKGDVVSLATEAVGNGRVYVGGTVWVSNFEVTSDGSNGNDYGDASYANKTIITNILSGLLVDPEISTIAKARAGNDGDIFTVKGTVIAGSVSPNAFFDCIYIQDGTGAICLHPVNDTVGTFRVGQTVVATGYRGDYQGDVQLGQVISAEVVDSTVSPISPVEYTLAEARDYDNNGGYLAKVSGTVKSVTASSGQISTVILTDGTNDFRLLFNNYIGYSNSASPDITTFVKEGAEISAVGVIYMDPQGACLRVRDLSEVELVTEDKPEEPDEPDRPIQPGKPSKPSDEDKPEEPDEPFIDVDENDWFYDAVTYVYSEGMMDGVSDTQFAPNSNLTRGMVVTMLYRLEDEPRVTGSSGFDDVASGAWYADAVTWAAENGIVNGVSDAEFAPNDNITREQLAAILYRYAEYNDYDVSGRDDLSEFTDRNSISGYALDAMRWAVDEGLITGITDTTIEPQGTATRAQAATMFMRFMSTVK